ncbi:DEAD/DEAH box helicase family protein [Paenibacillus athensensis]|uniref:DNA helicase n=1 Tax=Paenibacillus athensensis TaxID=1967502 RepID=A0A4Y8Q358_9BACL|nr:DEAD/DEAH box helicase family protein [Paenibacillus athensensis]MCD1261418.1 DEAD/DEAH box helicase family protein [Paenibacillus athensensis]
MPDIKLITENLADELIPGIERAAGIYIMTSFVMRSGVQMLAPHLKAAAERGADIKILCGDYLFITQPEGLRALVHIDARIEARLWHSRGASFHPKAYLMDYEQGEGLLIVGSSNLSRSAFRMGVEWNLAMNAEAEPYTFRVALDKFMEHFYDPCTVTLHEESIAVYERDYMAHKQKNPELVRTVTEIEESELMLPHKEPLAADREAATERSTQVLEPRPAQELALAALEKTREEQYDKAMVVMATGLGKTYVAAFFARRYRRVLFVAHREEILQQALRSFQAVMPERSTGLYNGLEKEPAAEHLFASIYTLGMKKHRERFATDHFDLIVVDEFHHAAAKTYQSILAYFRPAFLLGLTATPDRLDGKDVFALCDGNVAFQLHFLEAIQRQWLSPFRYYGVYDQTDYSAITWLGSRYDEEELLRAQLRDELAEQVFEAWRKHKQTRTIAFCSSIRQANFLASYFLRQGVSCISLHSRTTEMGRTEAIERLTQGRLDVIFTVDLFNEGVDIPAVDTLLFARPTESLTIFTQQIGRGLRLHPGKTCCTIIDLIGNYRNADMKLGLLDMNPTDLGAKKQTAFRLPVLPAGCELNVDVEVIDLLEELARKKQPRKEKLRQAYLEVKHELGRRPSYLELHLHGRAVSREYVQEFRSYVGFLAWAEELSAKESAAYLRYEAWLKEVESTVMAKSYKMTVLLYMLERGPADWMQPITPREAAAFFHTFYMEKEFRKRIDFSDGETSRLWTFDESKVAKLIAGMPMSKWSGSSKGLVAFEDQVFRLNIDVLPEDAQLLHAWTREICLYRLHVHFERRSAERE